MIRVTKTEQNNNGAINLWRSCQEREGRSVSKRRKVGPHSRWQSSVTVSLKWKSIFVS